SGPASPQTYTLSLHDALPIYLHVMAGAPGPKVGAARAVFGLSGHFGEHGFEVPVRFLAAPRHERRPAERAFFSAAHPHAKKAQRSEEHTSELQSLAYLVCRLL